jgi:hypothetical protein
MKPRPRPAKVGTGFAPGRGPTNWQRRFDDPIPLGDGRELATLREAADHIMRLPKSARDSEPWQLAGRILIAAAEGRDFPMHARIAVAKALALPEPPTGPRRRKAKKYRIVR